MQYYIIITHLNFYFDLNTFSQLMTYLNFLIKFFQRDAIAAFIYSSVLPAATAFSIKASDIAELLPNDKRS